MRGGHTGRQLSKNWKKKDFVTVKTTLKGAKKSRLERKKSKKGRKKKRKKKDASKGHGDPKTFKFEFQKRELGASKNTQKQASQGPGGTP